MSKRTATDNLFTTLSTVKVDIQEHPLRVGEISDISYNDYTLSQKPEFSAHLDKLYRSFVQEVEKDLTEKQNTVIYMSSLKRRVSEIEAAFESAKLNEEAMINSYPYSIPTDKVSFFQEMIRLQDKFLKKVSDFIEDMLWEVNPDKENSDGFQLKFNMLRQEVIALFLLLEGAGMLENKLGSKRMEWFLEKYVLWQEKYNDGSMAYKKMKAVSTIVSQLRNRQIKTDEIAQQIKEDFSVANIEDRSDK